MNTFALIGIYSVLIVIGAWLGTRDSFQRPSSMTDSMKRSSLLSLLFGAMIIAPEWLNGTLLEHGWMLLLPVLLVLALSIGHDWLKLRRDEAETGQ